MNHQRSPGASTTSPAPFSATATRRGRDTQAPYGAGMPTAEQSPKPPKVFGVTTTRRGGQMRMIVQANSRKAAAEALNVTVGFLRDYGSQSWNPTELQAVQEHPPGTVLARPLDEPQAPYTPLGDR